MSNIQPLISVIVPVYNVEKYIDRCVNSIINQTYGNLEIILVDDGSPDACPQICDDYSKKDNRITVIHKSNGGLSDARNAGLEAARGSYVAFVDSDDYIHPDMIEKLYYSIEDSNADIAVCNYHKIQENDACLISITDEPVKYEIIENRKKAIQYFFGSTYDVFTVAWNKLYRRNCFQAIRFPKGKIHEDEFTTYKLLYQCNKVVYLKKALYFYLQRNGSIMGESFSEKRLHKLEAYQERLNFYINKGEYDLWLQTFFYYKLWLIRFIKHLNDSKKYTIELINPFKDFYDKQWKENYAKVKLGIKEQAGYWLFYKLPKVYLFISSTREKSKAV